MNKILILIISLVIIPLFSYTQDYWQHVHTNDTNNVISLKIANDGTIYYGGENGLFISHDDGLTWDFKFLLYQVWINSMEFDLDSNLLIGASRKLYRYDIVNDSFSYLISTPNNRNFHSIFVDTTGIYAGYTPHYILRFSNNEWSVLDIGYGKGTPESIVRDTLGVLYAGTTGHTSGGGVFRSFDNGDTWEAFGLDKYQVQSLAYDSYNRLYAGAIGHLETGNGGFFRYNYESSSWDTLSNNARVQSLFFNTEDSLYAGIYSIGADAGAWMSPDYGDTWINISSGLPDPGEESNNVDNITIDPSNHLYAVIGNQKSIYKSSGPTVIISENNRLNKNDFNVFPNPFTKGIVIDLKDKTNKTVTIQIYNLNGTLHNAKVLNITNNRFYLEFNKYLENGVYILKIITAKKVYSKKILKY